MIVRGMQSEAVTFEIDGRQVRDLNGNGQLDPYEDPRCPLEERVDDLLAQMTREEKVGLMFHPPIGIGEDGEVLEGASAFGGEGATQLVAERHLNHFNIYGSPDARRTAEWHNSLQRLAEGTRLGIPVTISSDPRHSFDDGPATLDSGSFSKWPEPIGLGAIGDEGTVRRFGDIARQEYRAVGIHVALHPMADVATEPRWARSVGTFGEDVELVGRLTAAYIRGFQGDELGPASVACMVKHFPGGGPQADGEDPHFPYGKDQVYPGGRFEEHLRPFDAADAVLRTPGRHRARAGRLQLQRRSRDRHAARPLRLRRRRLHGLGAHQRHADARRLCLGGEGVGRRGARRQRAPLPDHRGRL
jgi:beta-glucosidase